MDVKKYYRNKVVECKPLETLIEYYLKEEYLVDIDIDLNYSDSSYSIKKKHELRDTLRQKGEPVSFSASIFVKRAFAELETVTDYWFYFMPDWNNLSIRSHDLNLINEGFEYFNELFKLDYCGEDDIEEKKDKIAFVAHTFDESGQIYAQKVSRFLDLLGFEALSGAGFKPKSISRKVKERIDVSSLVVVIFSQNDDYTWLIQESMDREGKSIFFLLEEGVDWKPGIHGDVEYIKFPQKRIDSTYIPLLEGLDEEGFVESYKRRTSNALKQINANK